MTRPLPQVYNYKGKDFFLLLIQKTLKKTAYISLLYNTFRQKKTYRTFTAKNIFFIFFLNRQWVSALHAHPYMCNQEFHFQIFHVKAQQILDNFMPHLPL